MTTMRQFPNIVEVTSQLEVLCRDFDLVLQTCPTNAKLNLQLALKFLKDIICHLGTWVSMLVVVFVYSRVKLMLSSWQFGVELCQGTGVFLQTQSVQGKLISPIISTLLGLLLPLHWTVHRQLLVL